MKSLKINTLIKAKPEDVYSALTNKAMLEIWTGEAVEMSTEPGSEFSWWGGDICGQNIEFEQNKRLVQDWYFDEHRSRVTINFHTDKKGTYLNITQIDIPDEDFENIEDGWKESIVASLRELLED